MEDVVEPSTEAAPATASTDAEETNVMWYEEGLLLLGVATT